MIRFSQTISLVLLTGFVIQASTEFCNGGHVCSPPKYCCSLGCCYLYNLEELYHPRNYQWEWGIVVAGVAFSGALAACGWWLRSRCKAGSNEHPSDRASSGSFRSPPDYNRCGSFLQAPPPYNEVTAKPDLYPLVIYDERVDKGTSGFVMRYFRSLSHASTLDSLSSSFMCNVVNEANTIIPPPYSCNNSIDELSITGCERGENLQTGSIVSLANHRTTSDVSSLAAQSPCSPPRPTSPTIEIRELLDRIQHLPQLPCNQNRPHILNCLNPNGPGYQRPLSPGDAGSSRPRRTRGKMYMPLGLPNSRNKTKRWLSRSAPTTPSDVVALPFFPGLSRRSSETQDDALVRQQVPLLSEQDEAEANHQEVPLLTEQDEDPLQT